MKQKGMATHSSGNHAQAIARAAQLLGIPAYIVMPENAPRIKVEATRAYGAHIIFCEPTQQAREHALAEIVDKTGAQFVHPYDNYDVIAGQASAALELLEDFPSLDMMMTPVGGGGLLSGTALATHYVRPDIIVLGAEPKRVDDARRSLISGHIEQNQRTDTIADGLRTTLGERTLDIIKRHVTDILTAEEEEIIQAMKIIWERMKIIVEPSCSVPLAAILANKDMFKGKKIGVILTGGNVDLGNLPF
jgi:threonine dehydratase